MSTVSLTYEEFEALCQELLGTEVELVRSPPRRFGAGMANERFRGLWYRASGGFAPGGHFGLRRRLGFPRGRG